MRDEHGQGQGSPGLYLTGFGLSVVLTAVPFLLVMQHRLQAPVLTGLIVASAVMQIGVQLVFFLHLNGSSAQRWNLLALVYTLILLVMLVGLSVWIMAHLNYNMMIP